jgi:hypothetical protein
LPWVTSAPTPHASRRAATKPLGISDRAIHLSPSSGHTPNKPLTPPICTLYVYK